MVVAGTVSAGTDDEGERGRRRGGHSSNAHADSFPPNVMVSGLGVTLDEQLPAWRCIDDTQVLLRSISHNRTFVDV